ncbi:nitric oxide reductase transcription regulator, partial [Aeromonas veronii]
PPMPQSSISPAENIDGFTTNQMGLRASTDAFQSALITKVLADHNDNWAATARALDIDCGNLHRLAKRLGLK